MFIFEVNNQSLMPWGARASEAIENSRYWLLTVILFICAFADRPAQISAAQWQALLFDEPLLEFGASRLPLNIFVCVKTHRLNELWKSGATTFSEWLRKRGSHYVRGSAYEVHISDTR